MTRILVIGLQYPPHHLGGYEVSCRDVVERLAARKHDVAVLTSSYRRADVVDEPESGSVPVWRELTAWFRDADLWAPPWWQRWRIERENQRALERALDRHRPEVVGAWQMGALSLGLLTTIAARGIPIVYGLSDDWLSYAPTLDAWTRLFARLPRSVARAAGAVLRVPTTVPDLGRTGPFCFISELTRERARRYAPWSMDDTAIVYSGIDGTLFTPPATAATDRPWGGRLLYVGRYDPRKGIETLIRAMGHLDDETLEVQGTGDDAERARLARLADELGVGGRVEFGAVDRSALVERYRAADVVVFPSEWEEPFGLVPVEAMAVGTPVVATGVGGSGEFLFDGYNCVRFTATDPVDLAAAVGRVRDDAALRSTLVDNGFETAEFFDVDHLADAFEAWYVAAAEHFVNGRPPSRHYRPTVLDRTDG